MTREEIMTGLREVLSMVKPRLDLTKVSEDSRLVMDLGIDSLSMLLLSLGAENRFGIQFSNTKPFGTVGDVVDYIVNLK